MFRPGKSSDARARGPILAASMLCALAVTCSDELSRAAPQAVDPDKLIIVDCLLPGLVIKQGSRMTYMGPPRPQRLPAGDCEIRGGQYVAYDRANYSTALKVWLTQANSGDAQAQVYVGEIYEKGMGIPPDYAESAVWYDKAAKQGNVQGLNHSAYLYEQGLGVPKDPVRALNLYRQAAGLKGDDLTFVSEVTAAQAKIDQLTAQLEERDQSAEQLSAALDATRQQLAEQQALAERSKREADTLRKRVRQLQSQPQTAVNNQEIDRLKSELADRELKLSAQSAEVDKLAQASSQQSDALHGRLAEAERQDDVLRQQLGLAQAQADRDRIQLEAATARAQALDHDLGRLRDQVKTDEIALRAAEDKLLHAHTDTDRPQAEALKSAVAQQQVQLEREKAVISDLDAGRTKLESEVQRLQSAVAAARSQHRQDDDTTANLLARVTSANSEIVRRTIEQKDLEARLDGAERQIAQDNKALSENAARAGSNDAEVKRLNGELAGREATITEQKAQLAALNVTIESDKRGLDDYQKKFDELKQSRGPDPKPASFPPVDASKLGLGQNYALIVGNENYAHLPHLKTAVKDAEDVERVLSERYGFKGHTRLLRDATREQMINALYEIMKSLGEKDSLVIYYAGHGTLDAGTHQSYWLPIDADAQNPTNWVSDRDVTGWVAETKARHVLIVADSCYSGAMIHGAEAQLVSIGSKEAEHKRLMLLAKLPSRTVLTSGGLEPVLDSGPDGHSIFAHEFIETLSRNTEVIEATALYTTLFEGVRMSVMRVGAMTGTSIHQSPEIAWLADAGHETGGEFLFVPVAPPTS
jgi:hypothetical protein